MNPAARHAPSRNAAKRGEEEYGPDQRPGELQVGQWSYIVLYDRKRKMKPPPFPFGFRAPEPKQ